MVADVLYRAATKQATEASGSDGEGAGEGASEGSGRGLRLRRGRSQSQMMVPFENAVMTRHTPRE